MRALSLFSGYGGIDLALKQYITQTIAYVEIEEYAQKIIAYRMAEGSLQRAPILADVKNIRGKPGICDIIYGGFPCQDISVAGNGKGLEGERSGLFYEIIRLTKEIRPSFVFLENVPAIRTRGLEQVIKEFTEMGYDCRWTMLSAASVGANHKRERWFLLAHAKSNGNRRNLRELYFEDAQVERSEIKHKKRTYESVDAGQEPSTLADSDGLRKSSKQENWKHSPDRISDGSKDDANTNSQGLERQRKITERDHKKLNYACDDSWWATEPDVGRVANGVAFELDLIKEIRLNEEKHNTETVASFGKLSREMLQAMWNNRELAATSHNIYTERFYNSLSELPQRNTQGRGNMGAWFKRDKTLCDLLEEFCTETLEKSENVQLRLLKKLRQIKRTEEVEKGFRTDRIKALGNGVVPMQAKKAFEVLIGI